MTAKASEGPHRIERQGDGRHAVISPEGKVLGYHKSVWSAARQMHDIHPPVPKPGPRQLGRPAPVTPAPVTPSIPRP